MKRVIITIAMFVLASLVLTAANSNKLLPNSNTATEEQSTSSMDDGEYTETENHEENSKKGPNGGFLVEIGDSGYYAEAYLVSEDSTFYLFPIDSDKESTMEWEMESITVKVTGITNKDGSETTTDKPLTLKPYEEKNEEGKVEVKDYSQYEITDERLQDIKTLTGIISKIIIDGKDYNNLSFSVNTIY